MRLTKKHESGIQEGDLTPMIDMTFQLIAFFMVLINFSQSEQDKRILLPTSELAKPPDGMIEHPLTLHVTEQGDVIIGGRVVSLEGIKPHLYREAEILKAQGTPVSAATVIIRAHRAAQTGKVQELINLCQAAEFSTFALRAKEDVGNY
jgi:biopolymer transport protein ExbD